MVPGASASIAQYTYLFLARVLGRLGHIGCVALSASRDAIATLLARWDENPVPQFGQDLQTPSAVLPLMNGGYMGILDKVVVAVTPEPGDQERAEARAMAPGLAHGGGWLAKSEAA